MANPWYRTGTISVTNNSKAVVGNGTLFVVNSISNGDIFFAPDGKAYEVDTIQTDTGITLKEAYKGTTASNQPYGIVRFVSQSPISLASLIVDKTVQWESLIDQHALYLSGTATTTVTAPENLCVSYSLGEVKTDIAQADCPTGFTYVASGATLTSGWFLFSDTVGNYRVAQHPETFKADIEAIKDIATTKAAEAAQTANEVSASAANILHTQGSGLPNEAYTKAELDAKPTGFKNLIINGGFDIWQRGTDFTNLPNGSYSADRWVVYSSVGDITYNAIRDAGSFTSGYGLNITRTGGTGSFDFLQFIENMTRFTPGTVLTLSFEAFSSTDASITMNLAAVIGSFAQTVNSSVSETVNLTGVKQKYSAQLVTPDWSSMTIDWNNLEDTKLALIFTLDNTAGANLAIGNVQLEEGSVATPFEQRPIGLELSLCQRYYEAIYGSNPPMVQYTANGDTRVSVPFKVSKRVPPTCTVSGYSNVIAVGDVGVRANVTINPSIVAESNVLGIWIVNFATDASLQSIGAIISMMGHHNSLNFTADAEL